MKKLALLATACLVALFTVALPISAQNSNQTKEYKETLKKIMVLSGGTSAMDGVLPSLKSNFSAINPELDEAYWNEFILNWKQKIEEKMLEAYVPIYQKKLTLNELNKVVAFYESPVGKKIGEIAPVLMTETLPIMQQLAQEMAMELMGKVKKQTVATEENKEEQNKDNGQDEESDDQKKFAAAYTAPKDSIEVADKIYETGMDTHPILYAIERREDDTKVTFLQPIYFDSQWLHYSPGFKIIDKKSGDEYLVRGYAGGAPFGRLMIIKGFKYKYIYVSLLFPKLKNNVKEIDILELPSEQDVLPSNDDGVAKSFLNIKIKDYSKSSKKNKKVYR